MRRTVSLLIRALPVVMALCGTRLSAQNPRTSVSDSALTDFVALSTFKLLVGYTARASQGVRSPWIVEVPEDSPNWRALAQHARVVLNARDTSASDSRRMMLRIDKPRVTRDSVFVLITVHITELCAKRWMHTGTAWEARAAHNDPLGFAPELIPLIETHSFECRPR